MMDAGLLIVIDVLTPPTSIPLKRIRMSSRDDTATPHVPNSPFASGSSVSYPYRVGISKATLRPVSPWAMRYLNRRFVSSGLPNLANIRIVHSRPRYMVGWIPRVNGKPPGLPSRSSGFPATSSGVYNRFTGRPEVVVNSLRRSGSASSASRRVVSCHRFNSSSRTFRSSSSRMNALRAFNWSDAIRPLRPVTGRSSTRQSSWRALGRLARRSRRSSRTCRGPGTRTKGAWTKPPPGSLHGGGRGPSCFRARRPERVPRRLEPRLADAFLPDEADLEFEGLRLRIHRGPSHHLGVIAGKGVIKPSTRFSESKTDRLESLDICDRPDTGLPRLELGAYRQTGAGPGRGNQEPVEEAPADPFEDDEPPDLGVGQLRPPTILVGHRARRP